MYEEDISNWSFPDFKTRHNAVLKLQDGTELQMLMIFDLYDQIWVETWPIVRYLKLSPRYALFKVMSQKYSNRDVEIVDYMGFEVGPPYRGPPTYALLPGIKEIVEYVPNHPSYKELRDFFNMDFRPNFYIPDD